MARSLLLLSLLFALVGGQGGAPAFARHDVAKVPWTTISPELRVRVVVGQVGSFAFGELTPGAARRPHHHAHEQINVGLTGLSRMLIDGRRIDLPELGVTLAPANVEHVLQGTDSPSTAVEFQPVRRLDLLPQGRSVTWPAAPTAAPVAHGRAIQADMATGAAGWESPTPALRMKTLAGQSSAVSAWEATDAGAVPFALERRLPASEQFVYVVRGRLEVAQGATRVVLERGDLGVNAPAGPALEARPVGGPATVLVFEARLLTGGDR